MSPRRSKFKVPIHDAVVHVVVADGLQVALEDYKHLFETEDVSDCKAFCITSKDHNFGLFFRADHVNMNTVAHEVFHLTHSIMQWNNVKFSATGDEAGALLMGFLMEQVTKKLKL